MAKLAKPAGDPARGVAQSLLEARPKIVESSESRVLADAKGPGMLLEPREPFSFSQTLRFILSPPALLNGRQFAPLLDHFEEGEYRRAADLEGQPVLYGVKEVPGPPVQVQVRILAGPRDERAQRVVCSLVEKQFSTRLDLAPFARLARSDRVLAKLWTRFQGMRIPQAASVYETLLCAIIDQQVNLSFAHQVKKALIEMYGKGLDYQGRRYSTFPEPAALAITTPRELRRLQISGPKAKYIIALSRATLDGTVDLEGLRNLDPVQAHARLLEHKGVGPWTAHYVGLRALAHLDCLPAADVGLQKSIHRFYGLRKQPSVARVERLARSWTGWRSYATFYLWLTYWESEEWKQQVMQELRLERRRQGGIGMR
jgi:DNA-3-methyladenine glycosylase II